MGPFECPRAWRRVNQAAFAVGTLAVAGAYLKIANAGSYRRGPKLVIAALLVEKPRSTGDPGMPVKLIEPPSEARNAAENRPDAIASVCSSDQLWPSRRPHASHRAGFTRDGSPDHVRFDTDYPRRHPERRPAPRRNSPRFLRFALQQAWLLRLVPALAPFS